MENTSLAHINPQEMIFGSIVFFSGEVPSKILNGEEGVIFLTKEEEIGEFIRNDKSWEMWIGGELQYKLEPAIYDFITREIKISSLSDSKQTIKELLLNPNIQYKSKIFLSIIYDQLLRMIIFGNNNGIHKMDTLPFAIAKTKCGIFISCLN